jgi:hypothetical protein
MKKILFGLMLLIFSITSIGQIEYLEKDLKILKQEIPNLQQQKTSDGALAFYVEESDRTIMYHISSENKVNLVSYLYSEPSDAVIYLLTLNHLYSNIFEDLWFVKLNDNKFLKIELMYTDYFIAFLHYIVTV